MVDKRLINELYDKIQQNQYEEHSVKEDMPSTRLIEAARSRVSKAKAEGNYEKIKERAKKQQQMEQDQGPFLTGFKLEEENVQEKLFNYNYIPNKIEDDDVLETIKSISKNEDEDDLARLRRMIKETKGEITQYAGETYELNSLVTACNKNFQNEGLGVASERFWDNEHKINKYMPNGKTNQLFNKKR